MIDEFEKYDITPMVENNYPFNREKSMSSLKSYLTSSALTFVSAFAIAVLPFLGGVEWERSAVVALILVGVRAAIKAVLESLAILKAQG